MLTLKDVADYIAGLGIVDADHIWIGKLQDKVEKSIGVYPLKRAGIPRQPIGGTDHAEKRISILVHWNKNVLETEKVSGTLFYKLMTSRNVTVNDQIILFNQMQVSDPVPVGTDDNGIYEYVIEMDVIYKR